MYGAGDVRVEDAPDPTIQQPTDAIVRTVRSCICGSDLHPYHSLPADAVTPKSQTLYVTDGIGLVGTRTGTQEIRPGDVVYIEPGEEHRHGATPERFMAHVAIQEADEHGVPVTWLDHVTDEEYGA